MRSLFRASIAAVHEWRSGHLRAQRGAECGRATGCGVTRRHVLAAGTGLGALALAGCGGAADESGSAESSDTAGDDSGGSLVALDDVAVGASVSATSPEDEELIVTRTSKSDVVAFSAICTHKGCTVKPAGDELHCPCHGSRYSAATGKVLGGPAPKRLPKVPVRVESGEVVLR